MKLIFYGSKMVKLSKISVTRVPGILYSVYIYIYMCICIFMFVCMIMYVCNVM